MKALDVLQQIDFEWSMHMESIWRDSSYDVPSLNGALRNEILKDLNRLLSKRDALSPLGRIILGVAGSGKTHLLGALRQKVSSHNIYFVLADMTDVHNFWETILLGYINSLQQRYFRGKRQYRLLLERLVDYVKKSKKGTSIVKQLLQQKPAGQIKFTGSLLDLLSKKHLTETRRYQDVVRALVLLNSDDFATSDIGHSWLQGLGIEDNDRVQFQFRSARKQPMEIVKGLSWIMSLTGPTIVALDQMDSIVTTHHLASGLAALDNATEEQRVSQAIIQGIAGGIMALRDVTTRSLILISCLETTWDILKQKSLKSSIDRFKEPYHLKRIQEARMASQMVKKRVKEACDQNGFDLPGPAWPFPKDAFQQVKNWTPRKILQHCDRFRARCLEAKQVINDNPFQTSEESPQVECPGAFQHLNESFEVIRKKADASELLQESNEDALGKLLADACRFLILENPAPFTIDVLLDSSTFLENKTPPMHARIRVVYREEGDREVHHCIRAIQKKHPNAFRPRLKAAMTESGIDRNLSFRKLTIIRTSPPPSGAATEKLLEQFQANGGVFVEPSAVDLEAVLTLQQLEQKQDPDFKSWLKSRKIATNLPLLKNVLEIFKFSDPADQTGKPLKPATISGPTQKTVKKSAKSGKSLAVERTGENLPVGHLLSEDGQADPFSIPLASLSSHVTVLAGSGSGKTVLVKRLIEESALLGIPSIVIDCAGDLSRLDDPWPEPPESWGKDDPVKAEQFEERTRVSIWTPGMEKGNPVYIDPVPDFSSIRANPDELEQAIMMARESLVEIVAPGTSLAARNKAGVLSAALHHFATLENSSGLSDLIDLLSNLPNGAGGGISNADKLAREMADNLRAQLQLDVMLRSGDPLLDPARLFGIDDSSKTAISVISFAGLPTLASQRQFLNQLAMTLFTWIRKNPADLRGLLIIDEAKDFVPSQQSSPCKSSILRLAAQARKYGLGMIFATQAPKSIDHNIIANCATQFYGRASSPAAIDVIQDQIRNRGGTGNDVPRLTPGQFYAYSSGMEEPAKIQAPMCLTHHPQTPLTEEEIREKAARIKSGS